MQKLKFGDTLMNVKEPQLKQYLDANYTFALLKDQSQVIYKDTSYDYPYRFKTSSYNKDIYGCWNGYDYIVIKCPQPTLNLTRVIRYY